MKKTGLEIVEMIAKGEAPKKIKKLDYNSVYEWQDDYRRYITKENSILKIVNVLNDEFEIIEESKVWKPKYNQVYFYINFAGEIVQGNWIDDSMDKYNYDTGNCFKTKLEGKKEKERKIIKKKLERYALEHNEEKIDWENKDQCKHYIYYDFDCEEVIKGHTYFYKDIGQIYFTSKKIIEQAIEEIGEDNIKKLFEE